MEQTIEIQKSRRKTISLSITKECTVLVKAPLQMSHSDIQRFVEKHAHWIAVHLRQMEERVQNTAKFTFSDNQIVPFLGQPLCIHTVPQRDTVLVCGMELHIAPELPNRQEAVLTFLRQTAKTLLIERTFYYAQKMNSVPQSIKITSARTRWGSCSSSRGICYSFRLLCLPLETIDAIVVHELAHLRVPNHSANFYQEVERYLPDYKERTKNLKTLASQILF